LLLLLLLSTVFVFSVLYSSHGFGSTAAEEVVVLTRSPLVGDPDVSTRLVPGEEERADEPVVVPAENNVNQEQSSPAEISLPSANSSSPPTPGTAERTGEQSEFKFLISFSQ